MHTHTYTHRNMNRNIHTQTCTHIHTQPQSESLALLPIATESSVLPRLLPPPLPEARGLKVPQGA